jgi:phasin
MNTTTATKPAGSPKFDEPRAFAEMAEKGATQAREAFGKMSAATSEVSDLIKASSSTALSGLQDYNNKFLEFAHANSNAAYEYVRKLHGVRSPSEFIELTTQHARAQTEALTDQSKQLMELAQKVALATAEPLKTGFAKALDQAH